MDKIRTRIAPSPTGPLHIGTARTALVNYIFARQNKGEFLIRIEDTDTTRNTSDYKDDILDSLKWLGLSPDEAPVYQSQRTELYSKTAEKLIASESAYRKEGAIWFKIPHNRDEVEFTDLIHGKVSFATKDLKDFVIIRSDGSPIFYLSTTIDDAAMKISHVIRGDDHLSNTPKQILLAEALGYALPTFAHIPLILNPDRSKMSKRKNPVSLSQDFKAKGYLPDAIINFLTLVGWHPSQKQEQSAKIQDVDIMNLNKIIEIFELERMQKGGAIFDITKLDSINRHYIYQKNDLDLVRMLTDNKFTQAHDISKIGKAVHIVKDRMNKLQDFDELTSFIWNEPDPSVDMLIFRNSSPTRAKIALESVLMNLTNIGEEVSPDQIKQVLFKIVDDKKLSTGDVFWTTRIAVSGLENSPPPEDIIWALGIDEARIRIKAAFNKFK